MPFAIAQIGKSFRNEVTPGNFIFRTIEFEQMELQRFCKESDSFEFYETLSELNPSAYMFYFPTQYGVVLGSSPEFLLKIKNKEIMLLLYQLLL